MGQKIKRAWKTNSNLAIGKLNNENRT